MVDVLTRVSTWPAAKRLALAREPLQTLSRDLGSAPGPAASVISMARSPMGRCGLPSPTGC
jgi:hypothetical protein